MNTRQGLNLRGVTLLLTGFAVVPVFALASCGSSSATGPAVSSPSRSSSASSTSAPPPPRISSPPPVPTAEFTSLHQGSTVSFRQEVTGRIANIPKGMKPWLMIEPVSAPAYWPQSPLLLLGGRFDTPATFGQNPETDSGDKFILIIVEATPDVSQQFTYFINHLQGYGLQTLPAGATPLALITVIRS